MIKGFKLIGAADKHEDLVKHAKQGALRGVYLGFPNVHEHYTMSLPGVTDWIGFPNSGKTQVLLEFLINTSLFYGWKHLVYLPDVGNSTEILSDLIHKYTGKTFDKRYANHITETEIANALPWVTEHFKVLTKVDLKARLTPYQLYDLAAEMKMNQDLQTVSIDAWKDMYHDTKDFGRDDKYLEDVLSYRNAMAEKHKLHFHNIIHPLKTQKDARGIRQPPGPYDAKGGSEWYNNGKSMVTVHRPDGAANEVTIYWNKIKPRSIGSQGESTLYFDLSTFRYYFDDDGEKRFADEVYYKPAKKASQESLFDGGDEQDEDLPF